MKKVHAYVYLGWHFLLHILSKLLLVYRPGGLARFAGYFEPEGLVAVDERERQLLTKWQSCIGCGLCEAACAELSVIPDNRHIGPQRLAESAVRDLSSAELVLPSVAALDDCDSDQLQQICPADIPLVELADFLARVGQRTRDRRQPPRRETPAD